MCHEWAAFTSFVADPKGPHRIGIDIDSLSFLNWFTKNMMPDFALDPGFFKEVLSIRNKAKSHSQEKEKKESIKDLD